MANNNPKAVITQSDNFEVTRCCIRSVADENGNRVTVRRCVTHESDAQIAMGAACALATADAKKAIKALTASLEEPIN
jgi:hypothetical protein